MELSDTDRRETAESFVTKTEPDHGSATPVDILIRILSYLPLFHISPPQAPEFWKVFDLFGKKTPFFVLFHAFWKHGIYYYHGIH